MVDAQILDANAAATARLKALAGELSDADLARDLGGGWTVAVALSHMAFWDRRAEHVFERWMTGGGPHAELDDDVVNGALEELHKAIEPRIALRLALEAAVCADSAVGRLPDAIIGQLIGDGHGYLLRRSEHRSEHLDQIEATLGRAA